MAETPIIKNHEKKKEMYLVISKKSNCHGTMSTLVIVEKYERATQCEKQYGQEKSLPRKGDFPLIQSLNHRNMDDLVTVTDIAAIETPSKIICSISLF